MDIERIGFAWRVNGELDSFPVVFRLFRLQRAGVLVKDLKRPSWGTAYLLVAPRGWQRVGPEPARAERVFDNHGKPVGLGHLWFGGRGIAMLGPEGRRFEIEAGEKP